MTDYSLRPSSASTRRKGGDWAEWASARLWIDPDVGDGRAYALPDPLADTPEGDHAFMEIVRWADVWLKEKEWFTEIEWSSGHCLTQIRSRANWDVVAEAHREREKAARILALAKALEASQ